MPTQSRPETQGAVLRELTVVQQLLATRLNQALKPVGLNLTSFGLLLHLARAPGPEAIGQISAAMEVNQPAVSKTLRSLTERGAVSVATTSTDGRRRDIAITDVGATLVTRGQEAMHPEASVVLSPLADSELTTLLDLLTAVRSTLDEGRLAR